jgi:hypothetical protein
MLITGPKLHICQDIDTILPPVLPFGGFVGFPAVLLAFLALVESLVFVDLISFKHHKTAFLIAYGQTSCAGTGYAGTQYKQSKPSEDKSFHRPGFCSTQTMASLPNC